MPSYLRDIKKPLFNIEYHDSFAENKGSSKLRMYHRLSSVGTVDDQIPHHKKHPSLTLERSVRNKSVLERREASDGCNQYVTVNEDT